MKLSQKQVDALIAKFNEKFPVGSVCPMRSMDRDGVPFEPKVVRGQAYDMHGQAVAFFEGKAGCYSIEPEFVNYQAEVV